MRGWAVSDDQGRYRFDTIRPASYPTRDVPAHIHMHVLEPGCSTYYIDDVMFTDDPLLTPAQRRAHAAGRGGNGIVTPARTEGRWQVARDIRLGAGIPGHRACASPPAAQAAASDASCAWEDSFVSASATPLPAHRFRGIDANMTIRTIVAQLGPATRDVGSGLHVLEWDTVEGLRFLVSVTDGCGQPMAMNLGDRDKR